MRTYPTIRLPIRPYIIHLSIHPSLLHPPIRCFQILASSHRQHISSALIPVFLLFWNLRHVECDRKSDESRVRLSAAEGGVARITSVSIAIISSVLSIAVLLPGVMLPPERGGGPLNWSAGEWAGGDQN